MEAKDTVIHADGCTTNMGVIGATCNCGSEAQAEISFKAGEERGLVIAKENYIFGREHGRREVVEFAKGYIPKHHSLCYGAIDPHPDCDNCKWQAKKKEWGITE